MTLNHHLHRSQPSKRRPNRNAQYPNRPGMPVCDHYVKCGKCRFGSTCTFDHPTRDETLLHSLSQNECFDFFFKRFCHYGTACKYSHSRKVSRFSCAAPLHSAPHPSPRFERHDRSPFLRENLGYGILDPVLNSTERTLAFGNRHRPTDLHPTLPETIIEQPVIPPEPAMIPSTVLWYTNYMDRKIEHTGCFSVDSLRPVLGVTQECARKLYPLENQVANSSLHLASGIQNSRIQSDCPHVDTNWNQVPLLGASNDSRHSDKPVGATHNFDLTARLLSLTSSINVNDAGHVEPDTHMEALMKLNAESKVQVERVRPNAFGQIGDGRSFDRKNGKNENKSFRGGC